MAKPRVALCIPSGSAWMGATAYSVLCLGIASGEEFDLLPINLRGHDTAEARNTMVRAALENDADWLLWIDADMDFPADSLRMLMRHDKDIVGADYRRRTPPFPKIGLAVNPADPLGPPLPLTIEEETQSSGLVERAVLGLGLLLVRADVFRTATGPWFARIWNEHAARPDNPFGMTTEDCLFCHASRMRGYKVWCDLDLSAHVRHVAEFAVQWDKTLRPS